MTRPQKLINEQMPFLFNEKSKSRLILPGFSPYYSTDLGDAYLADSLDVLKTLPGDSINTVITSPPYALHFKKEYGNAAKHDYLEWFLPFATEIFRVLQEDGSFILNIGGSYNEGFPTRSLYHFKLLISLVEQVGFKLAQECFWFNPAKMPMPAEWVTVRRIRIRDSVEYVWWLSKSHGLKRTIELYSSRTVRTWSDLTREGCVARFDLRGTISSQASAKLKPEALFHQI